MHEKLYEQRLPEVGVIVCNPGVLEALTSYNDKLPFEVRHYIVYIILQRFYCGFIASQNEISLNKALVNFKLNIALKLSESILAEDVFEETDTSLLLMDKNNMAVFSKEINRIIDDYVNYSSELIVNGCELLGQKTIYDLDAFNHANLKFDFETIGEESVKLIFSKPENTGFNGHDTKNSTRECGFLT